MLKAQHCIWLRIPLITAMERSEEAYCIQQFVEGISGANWIKSLENVNSIRKKAAVLSWKFQLCVSCVLKYPCSTRFHRFIFFFQLSVTLISASYCRDQRVQLKNSMWTCHSELLDPIIYSTLHNEAADAQVKQWLSTAQFIKICISLPQTQQY